MHVAKTHLSRLVEAAAGGEEIIIAKSGKPVARLGPLTDPHATQKRRLGILAGKAVIPPDFLQGFDAPLPDAILDAFEGSGEGSGEGA